MTGAAGALKNKIHLRDRNWVFYWASSATLGNQLGAGGMLVEHLVPQWDLGMFELEFLCGCQKSHFCFLPPAFWSFMVISYSSSPILFALPPVRSL